MMSTPASRFSSMAAPKLAEQYGDDLQSFHLVDIAPNSVPQATFLRLPNDPCYEQGLYLPTDMTPTGNITEIHVLHERMDVLNTVISKFYSHRSIMEPLQDYVKENPSNAKDLAPIAKQYTDPLVKLVNEAMDQAHQCAQHLQQIFSNKEMWTNGHYSVELLEAVCETIFRLFVLDKLRSSKKAVAFDLTALNQMMIAGTASGVVTPAMTKWLNDSDSIERDLLDALKLVPSDLMGISGQIFYRYIKETLSSESMMLPDSKYALLISLAVFMKVSPTTFSQTEANFVRQLFETTPYIPLYCEFAVNICEFVSKTELFKSSTKFEQVPVETPKMVRVLRKRFSEVATRLHHATASQQRLDSGSTTSEIINACVEAIKLISSTTDILKEQYAAKLAKPPKDPQQMKPYERSVRYGYAPTELKAMLQLLALCRGLHDLIRMNLPSIYPKICSAIQHTFQDVIKNVLEVASVKCKRKKKALKKLIDQIRGIGGDWLPGENPAITAKKETEIKTREIPVRVAAPSSKLIDLVRIQFQHILNPESRFMQPSKKKAMKGKRCLPGSVEKRLHEFLSESTNWVKLLSLEQSLTLAADQSCFYFKEVQLDMNDAVQFPVRSSVPFTLCQFALDNYVQPDLTEVIFYPLSIYDDAANMALTVHKSRMMFDEIRAEAQVCLDTLSVLIGDFTFNGFRTFAALRQLPDKIAAKLKMTHERRWPNSQAYRLRTLLQQNQYYLLSRQVALKSLIAPRVDQELNNAVAKLFHIGQEHGVVASLAISQVLGIVRETHRLLMEQGLPLMPFKDIERTAKWDNNLESFASKYLRDVTKHLFRMLARRYILYINPLRLLPPRKVQLPTEPLGQLNLGKILKDVLDSSVAFVTVHHFSVFLRQLSDGAIVLLSQSLHQHIKQSFTYFLGKYNDVRGRLTRIKDAPFGTSAHAAFTRYEGAYKFLLNDHSVMNLLSAMQNIGNTFAVAELIDEALSMKEFNVVQVMSYLRSVDNNGTPRDEIGGLFDQEFRDALKIVTARPMTIAEDSQQVLLTMAVNEFLSHVNKEFHVFEEPNEKSHDFTTMTGFAAVWSVIEFLYCLMESGRAADEDAGFAKYGQGVILCAALMLLGTNQVNISKLLSIGRKMQRHNQTDMSGLADEKIIRFLAVSQMDAATLDWGFLFFQPFVDNYKEHNPQ